MKPKSSISHENSKTLAFRVSEEDYEKITMLIDISGYARQDYLLERALQEEITVYPNSRVQHYLEKYLVQILEELKRLESTTADKSCLHKLETLIKVISKLS